MCIRDSVEVIYFNPLFVSPSNHKYDIQDYDYIDPHYGKIVSDGGDTLADWDKDNSHATRYIRRVTDKEDVYKRQLQDRDKGSGKPDGRRERTYKRD